MSQVPQLSKESVPELEEGRFIFYVDETMHTEHGYRPSVLVEGVAGHFPNGGGDVEPWYWGHDLAGAQKIAHDRNAAMGLTPSDESRILMSSMRGSLAGGSPDDTPPICECDNCSWTGHADELRPIENPAERIAPGGIAPAGECPECGALAYAHPSEEGATLAEPATPSPSEASDAASITVIVEVSGGVVQTVYADDPLTAVHVLDRDNQKDGDCSDEERERYGQIEAMLDDPKMRALIG